MKYLGAILASALLAGSLFGEVTATRGPIGFDTYDKNKDGFISEEEFNTVRAERMSAMADAGMPMRNAGNAPDFAFFDTNKDGKISPDEFRTGQLKHMQENRQKMRQQ